VQKKVSKYQITNCTVYFIESMNTLINHENEEPHAFLSVLTMFLPRLLQLQYHARVMGRFL